MEIRQIFNGVFAEFRQNKISVHLYKREKQGKKVIWQKKGYCEQIKKRIKTHAVLYRLNFKLIVKVVRVTPSGVSKLGNSQQKLPVKLFSNGCADCGLRTARLKA
jgi:hypothetical protein